MGFRAGRRIVVLVTSRVLKLALTGLMSFFPVCMSTTGAAVGGMCFATFISL